MTVTGDLVPSFMNIW